MLPDLQYTTAMAVGVVLPWLVTFTLLYTATRTVLPYVLGYLRPPGPVSLLVEEDSSKNKMSKKNDDPSTEPLLHPISPQQQQQQEQQQQQQEKQKPKDQEIHVQELSDVDLEDISDKVVSTVHAIVVSIGTLHWMSVEIGQLNWDERLGYGHWPLREGYLCVTLSYLLFDLVRMACCWSERSQVAMVLHHVVINAAYALGIHYGYGTIYMGAFVLNELTTPSLNLRGFMALFGFKNSPIYVANEAIFAIGFFFIRVVYNIAVVLHMTAMLTIFWPKREVTGVPVIVFWFLPVLAYSHVALNLYWFALIWRMVQRKFSTSTSTSTSKEASGTTAIKAE